MTRRRTAAVAWSLAVVCGVCAIATLGLLVVGIGRSTPGDEFVLGGLGGLMFTLAALAFAVVGALVAVRVPDNRIGWVLGAMGLLLGFGALDYSYADYALFVASPPLPGGELAAWQRRGGDEQGVVGVAVVKGAEAEEEPHRAEDPADPVVRHADGDERADHGERERGEREHEATEATEHEFVAGGGAPDPDHQQAESRDRADTADDGERPRDRGGATAGHAQRTAWARDAPGSAVRLASVRPRATA